MNAWLIIIPVCIALWLLIYFYSHKSGGSSNA